MKPTAAAIRFPPDAIGVGLVAICGAAMAAWTWGTWPDPIVDFGSQLYNAWQLSVGKVLYRDLAYFNGPLSQYFNAAMLRCFGVGLWTIAGVNLAVAAISAGMIYLILRKIGSPLTATMGGISFVCLFAFGRFDKIGNFNWICPYRQEVTHGIALSLAAILCLARWASTRRRRWLMAAGFLCGLVFLTKAENFFSLAAAVTVGLLIVTRRPKHLLLFFVSAVVPVAMAFVLLAMAMPVRTALLGTLGSLPWMFDSRIGALDFYRQGMGLMNPGQSVAVMLRWSAGYAAVFAAAGLWGWFVPARRKFVAFLPAMVFLGAMAWCVLGSGPTINWLNAATPLTVIAVLGAALALRAVFAPSPGNPGEGGGEGAASANGSGSRNHPHPGPLPGYRERELLRLMFAVFALVTLGKMFLAARITDYGFALAMPAFMVAIDLFAGRLPAAMNRAGKNGAAATAMAVLSWAALLGIYLAIMAVHMSDQTVAVGAGQDEFFADSRGTEVNAALARLKDFDPGRTLAVLPQGRMINYLSRRANSVWLGDYMPPEVISLGESAALAAMEKNPPDIVILTGKDVRDDELNFPIGDYRYGKPTMQWILSHYRMVGPAPKSGDEMRFEFLVREKTE